MAAEIFLDNNATTKPLPEVIEAAVEAMSTRFGNPSSANSTGERARALLENARSRVASLIGASQQFLHFTSGATEANNWVIQNWLAEKSGKLVTSTAEHSSVKALAEEAKQRGLSVQFVPVDEDGRIRLDNLGCAIDSKDVLVSVHWANNETGVIQPVEAISRLCRSRGARLHLDASQAVGKIPVDLTQLHCDYLSLSGHKIHGPQGVGALYVHPEARISPLIGGGGQERGLRGGTENLPGIVGMGAAALPR